MSAHTPGPWKRERHVKGSLMDVASDRPFSGKEIPVRIASDITKANADLIAAAPDLLAALEAVAHERDFVVRCNDHIQGVVRAAIAKARGES